MTISSPVDRLFVMKSIIEEASSLAKAFNQAWERAGKPEECTIKILAEPEKNFIGMTTKSAKIALFFNEPAPIQNKKSSTHSSPSRSSKNTPVQTQQQTRTQTERQQPAQRPTEQRTTEQRPRQEARPVEQRLNEQRPAEQKPVTSRSTEQRSNEPRQRQQPAQRPVEQRSTEVRTHSSHENLPRESAQKEIVTREKSSHDTTQSETTNRSENSATQRIRPIWTEEMNQGVRTWIQESLEIMGRTEVEFATSMARSMLTITFAAPLIEELEKERLLFRSWSHLIVQHIKQEFKVHGKEFKIILKGSRN